jgi:hypothetical protein
MLAGITALAMALGSKEAPEKTQEPPQGVTGKVEIWKGDFMPKTDPNSSSHSVTPAAGRTVRLYEPVETPGLTQAVLPDVPMPMVAETTTDENGEFYLPVKPGTYSIFVKVKDGWYFNGWNGKGVQGAVTVESGKNTNVLIKVTTDATF